MNLLDVHPEPPHPVDPDPQSPHERMWEMIAAYRVSQIVRAIARFGVAEHLAAGRHTASAIAAAEALDPDATFRLLRAAASLGVLAAADDGGFGATELLETLAAGEPGSLRGLALALNEPGHWLPWGRLDESIRGGSEQATATLGTDLWDYYRRTPEEAAHFSEAMSGMTAAVGEAAANAIDTTRFAVAADIGGAGGSLMHDLLAANPALQGVVFDLPHVAAQAADRARELRLTERLTAVGGNFFASVPAADAYLLRYVLHDWDDDACVTILRNCRQSMNGDGRVFVLEMAIGPIGERSPAPLQDMQMLVGLPGGRERTVAEFDCLMHQAGLRLVATTLTDTPVVILEAAAA